MIDAIKKIQYVLIFIGVLILTIFIIIIYNIYSFRKFKEDNEDDMEDHLLHIASNKQFLKNLKKNVNEENVEYSEEIEQNRNKIEKNKQNLNTLKTNTSVNFENVHNKIDKNERDIILNKTDISKVNTDIQNANSTYAKEIDTIRQKQNNIQANLGTFKYSDYEQVLSRVGRNEERIGLAEDKQYIISSNLGIVQSKTIPKLENSIQQIEDNFITESKLEDYFNDNILPKHSSLSNIVYKNKENIESHSNLIDSMNSRFDNYYTSKQVDTNFMTTTDINDKFSQYYTSNQVHTNFMTTTDIGSNVNDILKGIATEIDDRFMTTTDINNKFSQYYTSNQVDTTLQGYYTKTEAGNLFVEEEDDDE